MAINSDIRALTLNQIRAGREIAKIFPGKKDLGRSLCLLASAGTAINLIFQKRIITEQNEKGNLSLVRVYEVFSQVNGRFVSANLPRGFLIASHSGNMYHHVVVALAEAIGLDAVSLRGVDTLKPLKAYVKTGQSSVIISVKNSFTWEQVLRRKPPKNLNWQEGRHVISILELNNDRITIADPFNWLHPNAGWGIVADFSLGVVKQYLKGAGSEAAKAIIFSRHNLRKLPFTKNDIFIPPEIIGYIHKAFASSDGGLLSGEI